MSLSCGRCWSGSCKWAGTPLETLETKRQRVRAGAVEVPFATQARHEASVVLTTSGRHPHDHILSSSSESEDVPDADGL
eukprot:10760692-Lingulodinium_polyedra.AAC.1